ncbi:unnamed protein product, partial [Cyprideis torosa]
IHDAIPLIHHLEKDERVKGVTSQVKAQVFYNAGSIELNGLIHGIEVREEMKLFNFGDYIIEGDAQAVEYRDNTVLLGAGIAKKMSVGVGDRVQ